MNLSKRAERVVLNMNGLSEIFDKPGWLVAVLRHQNCGWGTVCEIIAAGVNAGHISLEDETLKRLERRRMRAIESMICSKEGLAA